MGYALGGEPFAYTLPSVLKLPFSAAAVSSLSFCPSQPAYLLAGRADGSVSLYHVDDGRPLLASAQAMELRATAVVPSAGVRAAARRLLSERQLPPHAASGRRAAGATVAERRRALCKARPRAGDLLDWIERSGFGRIQTVFTREEAIRRLARGGDRATRSLETASGAPWKGCTVEEADAIAVDPEFRGMLTVDGVRARRPGGLLRS